jgi:DNA ligase-1
MAKSNRRELLQLANKYNPAKSNVAGYYASEKLDGGRCFWDGGVSRGLATGSIPWSSVTDPESGLRKAKIKAEATGLWSRYGNPIAAPEWFLNQLPTCPLDGELWTGRGNFQQTMSAIRKDVPIDAEWRKVRYAVYSAPAYASVFADGEIKNANMVATINRNDCIRFCLYRRDVLPEMKFSSHTGSCFEIELAFLNQMIETQNDVCFVHRQVKLSNDLEQAREEIEAMLAGILDKGGEGIVLRDPLSTWTPKRHNGVLKYKPYDDDEATVVGFISGEEGKTGNLLGSIGALIVRWKDKEFKLGTGMTFVERALEGQLKNWAIKNPGQPWRETFNAPHFFTGRKVTFKFRELSDDGIPKEARYFRVRETE